MLLKNPALMEEGQPEDEASAYVTNLRVEEASAEQVVLLQRKRGDAENVFDEIKNQWGFRGFCSGRAVVTEVAARPKYLFKLRLTRNVRRAIAKIRPEAWRGSPTLGTEQVAETSQQLDGWSRPRRVVIARTLKPVNAGPQEEMLHELRRI
jgi:hypothetical protein